MLFFIVCAGKLFKSSMNQFLATREYLNDKEYIIQDENLDAVQPSLAKVNIMHFFKYFKRDIE